MPKGIPERVLQLLRKADERHGLPEGTMHAILSQETGGSSKYLNDPSAYHYEADAQGRRVAGHTGKISTAFGPFGILESTGAKPGYGVKPLKDKSLEEQIRFASDYLAAHSKRAGSLEGGLARYGEGEKYAQQVVGRLPAQKVQPSILAMPDEQAQNLPVPQGVPPLSPADPIMTAAPVVDPAKRLSMNSATDAAQPANPTPGLSYDNPWASLSQLMPRRMVQPADLNYGTFATDELPKIQPDLGRPGIWKNI